MTDCPAHLSCLPIFQVIRHEDVPPRVTLHSGVGVKMSISRSVVVNFVAHGRKALSSSSLHFRRPRGAASSLLILCRRLVIWRDGDRHWRIILRVWLGRFTLILFHLFDGRLLWLWMAKCFRIVCANHILHTLLLRLPKKTTAMELRRLPLLFESPFPPNSPRPKELRRDAFWGFCGTFS